MTNLKQITQFLDKELDVNGIDDSSFNGLQVESSKPIKKVGFAVDCCMETFKKAKKEGCDLLIVHHGLFWEHDIKVRKLTGINYRRVRFLVKNDIALYGVHLPLDKHPKYGNNVLLFRLLGATADLRPGGEFGKVGYIGTFKKPKKLKDIVKILNNKIDARCQIMKYGEDMIKTIAICSGGAQFDAWEAIDRGADLFITGEIGHTILHPVKEAKINIIGAGHYATETVGVKALMPLLQKKFKLKTVFLDSPTGL